MPSSLRAGVCVGAAIFRDGRLLMLRRADSDLAFPGWWDIPGGSVESDETLEEAVRREVWEETGLRVRVGAAFCASTFETTVRPRRRTNPRTIVAVQFRAYSRSTRAPRLDPREHSAYAWVPRRALERYPVPPSLVQAVRAAYQSTQ